MTKRSTWRALTATTATIGLVLGGVAAAHAVPTPDEGPVAGGTTVTIEAPAAPKFSKVFTGGVDYFAAGLDGTTYAWGANFVGQIGDGTRNPRPTPIPITTPTGQSFVSIKGGYLTIVGAGLEGHMLGLDAGGQAFAWGGDNTYGAYGNGTNVGSNSPVPVTMPLGVTAWKQIASGYSHSLAIADDDQVYAWGRNHSGQLGDGTTDNRSLPHPVTIPSSAGATVKQIGVGGDFSVALMSDGTVWSWGSNSQGLLGTGVTGVRESSPVQAVFPAGVEIVEISIGQVSSLALDTSGTIWAWGHNIFGTLANGSLLSSPTPTPINEPAGVRLPSFVTGGETFFGAAYAVGEDAQLYGWGVGAYGLVGDGSGADKLTPVTIEMPPGVDFDQVSPAGSLTFGLEADGTVWSWGFRNYLDYLDYVLYGGTPVTPIYDLKPVPYFVAEVTGVTFDGLPGTGLTDNGDGTYDVVTPPHLEGPVDVVVEWTLNGVAQTPVTYVDGYTYYTAVAPTITNPADQTVTEGSAASFSVTASGTPTPTVTWEVSVDGGTSWNPIATGVSADGLTLTVGPTTVAQSGNQYRATASNASGAVTSNPATLTVNPLPAATTPPTITNPSDQSVTVGGSTSFTVTATPGATVMWEVSTDGGVTWTPTAAGVSPDGRTLTVGPATAGDDGSQYRATASNSAGSATSTFATLSVTAAPPAAVAPTITDPADETVAAGGSATFTVTVAPPGATVIWQVSRGGGAWVTTTAGVSADGLTLTVASVAASDSGTRYRAIATNSVGSATSNPATLTVTTSAAPVTPGTPAGPGTPGTPTDPTNPAASPAPEVDTTLAVTGSAAASAWGIVGLVTLLAGGALVGANVLTRRRRS